MEAIYPGTDQRLDDSFHLCLVGGRKERIVDIVFAILAGIVSAILMASAFGAIVPAHLAEWILNLFR
jgi:hypothetical protein